MPRWPVFFVLCSLFLGAFDTTVRGDELSVSVPVDTKFVVRLDMQVCRGTVVGGKLFEMARTFIQEEMSDGHGRGKGPDFAKIRDVIGFDPLEEVQAIVVSASRYDHPEESVVVSVGLGKSSGNLEGLALGLPGYQAQEYGRHTIHSINPDRAHWIFGAVHTGESGNKTILMGTKKDAVTRQLDFLDGTFKANDSFKTIKLVTEGKPIVALEVFDLPVELLGDGPQSGIAKAVRAVSLRVGESSGKLDLGVSLTAATEKEAEQLRQMTQGLIAFARFAQSADQDDQDLAQVLKFVDGMKISRDGSFVKLNLSLPVDDVNKLIDMID